MTGRNSIDREDLAPRLAPLRRLVDTYGADDSRWPEPERARVQPILGSVAAGRLIADARALDRALEAARSPVATDIGDIDKLTDRIMAAAIALPAAAPTDRPSARIIPLPRPAGRARQSVAATEPAAFTFGRGRMAAGLIAACLLFGILLGGTVRVETVAPDVVDAFGLQSDPETRSTALADEIVEEDAL